MFWGSIAMDQVLKFIGSARISGGALILLTVAMFWVHAWADNRFAKVEDLTTLQETVEIGFESIAINDASAEIRDIKLSLQVAKSTDSEDIGRIMEQLEHARDYKECLVNRGSNCAHLREVE